MKSQIKQEGQAAETAEKGDDNLYDDVYELDETNGEVADDDLYEYDEVTEDEVYEFPEASLQDSKAQNQVPVETYYVGEDGH